MERITYLKETRDFDSRGNVVNYEEVESAPAEIEPYDPAYLMDHTENTYKLSRGEKKLFRMVKRLEGALRKNSVRYHWDGDCFVVKKTGDSYNYYFWVDESDWTYCFGTTEVCMDYSQDVDIVETYAEQLVSTSDLTIGRERKKPVLREEVIVEVNRLQEELTMLSKRELPDPRMEDDKKRRIQLQEMVDNHNKICYEIHAMIVEMKQQNKTLEELRNENC